MKVVTLQENTKGLEEYLKDSFETILKENPKGVMFACKNRDGSWLTGYYKIDFSEKAEAIAHINCDLIDQMILSNQGDRYK